MFVFDKIISAMERHVTGETEMERVEFETGCLRKPLPKGKVTFEQVHLEGEETGLIYPVISGDDEGGEGF